MCSRQDSEVTRYVEDMIPCGKYCHQDGLVEATEIMMYLESDAKKITDVKQEYRVGVAFFSMLGWSIQAWCYNGSSLSAVITPRKLE